MLSFCTPSESLTTERRVLAHHYSPQHLYVPFPLSHIFLYTYTDSDPMPGQRPARRAKRRALEADADEEKDDAFRPPPFALRPCLNCRRSKTRCTSPHMCLCLVNLSAYPPTTTSIPNLHLPIQFTQALVLFLARYVCVACVCLCVDLYYHLGHYPCSKAVHSRTYIYTQSKEE